MVERLSLRVGGGSQWTAILVVLSATATVAGCDFVGDEGANREGPGRRSQVLALNSDQELELGRQAYKEILSQPEKYGRVLPRDAPESKRALNVARKIVQAAGIEPLQREIHLRSGYRFEWEIHVLANPQVNAMCLPGGKMVVFLGLFRVVQNDDQLATVISHEIAHALAHHVSERIARQGQSQSPLAMFFNRKFDRQEEDEADHIGIFLMTFAGYVPREAVHLWERMEQLAAGHQRIPEILSDHPSDEHRIQAIRGYVPRALAAKEAYDEGHVEPASLPRQFNIASGGLGQRGHSQTRISVRRPFFQQAAAVSFLPLFEETLR